MRRSPRTYYYKGATTQERVYGMGANPMAHMTPGNIGDVYRIGRPMHMLSNTWREFMAASMQLFVLGPFDNEYVPVMLLAIAYSDNFTGALYNAAKKTLDANQKSRLTDNEEGIDYARNNTGSLFDLPWDIHPPGSTVPSVEL